MEGTRFLLLTQDTLAPLLLSLKAFVDVDGCLLNPTYEDDSSTYRHLQFEAREVSVPRRPCTGSQTYVCSTVVNSNGENNY